MPRRVDDHELHAEGGSGLAVKAVARLGCGVERNTWPLAVGSAPALGVDQGVSDVDEVCLKGEEDELDAVAGLGLGDEVADVGLDGGHGKPELVADLLIGEAPCDECEDLGFTVSERVEDSTFCWRGRGWGRSSRSLALESVEELPCWTG